ncbi:hypothetical protein JXB11_03025 [Candidatus Woesearchaeota archaeon]|nr:hypothetical protein [Candidatus Woesearchaeota archaeon]
MKLYLLIFAALIAAGCSDEISQESAELSAVNFVLEHVAFFSMNGTSVVDVPSYDFNIVSTKKEKDHYAVSMHVNSTLGNQTKEKSFLVKVDRRTGRVSEFDGKKIFG